MNRAGVVAMGMAFAALACEPEQLGRAVDPPDPPDAGFLDAAPPPPRDAGFAPDAAPPPDAGFAPDAAELDAGVPAARERIYVCSTDALYAFDPATATVTMVGRFAPFTGEGMIDIAIDLDGRMYGGSFSGGIYRINPETAEVERLFSVNIHPTGLTFLADGRLVVAGERVMIVDADTGVRITNLTMNGYPETSGDIIGLPNGSLYASILTSTLIEDDLVRIDPSTGAVTRIGSLGRAQVFGLAWTGGRLFGFGGDGTIVEIDPQTAQATLLQTLSEPWYGATTNPVLW